MANSDALGTLKQQQSFLNNAGEHVGNTIQTLRDMQALENMDITDAQENRLRFLHLASVLEAQGLHETARVAKEGAALEEQQITRNRELIQSQSTAIGLLQFIAGGLEKFSRFANRISRAFSDLLR